VYHTEGDEDRDSATGLAITEDDKVSVEDDESDFGKLVDHRRKPLC
jgi:hypothetical protein